MYLKIKANGAFFFSCWLEAGVGFQIGFVSALLQICIFPPWQGKMLEQGSSSGWEHRVQGLSLLVSHCL